MAPFLSIWVARRFFVGEIGILWYFLWPPKREFRISCPFKTYEVLEGEIAFLPFKTDEVLEGEIAFPDYQKW